MIRKLQETDVDSVADIWKLRLNVYQKNIRAIRFYQREGFEIQCGKLDDNTSEKEYVVIWRPNLESPPAQKMPAIDVPFIDFPII